MNRKKECLELIKDDSIVIVAPDYTHENKMRLYCNGGLIGRIYIGNSTNGKSDFISEAYIKYEKQLKNLLNKAEKKDNEGRMQILTSEQYIELCKNALKEKWTKKSKENDCEEDEDKKERVIETKILHRFMKHNKNWNAIDMEICFPESYCNNANFSKGTTRKPRFDIITISKEGIGIIELKVNNENCGNMNSHYEHMKYIQKHECKFKNGIINRIQYLIENGLLSEDDYEKYKNDLEKNKIWFGFLFVGGEKEKSIDIIRERLKTGKNLDGIKFMYCDFKEVKNLNIEKMMKYEDFIKS